ncbi:cell filamentation protein Fic [Aeromicrobium camelliae]|uniref:protein adenylyltransferase n=1 Tax=Aeromicrobium camelliae TaxID=1538144 RepID=A0A3N6W3D9_9ACTN|nr:Fic family protein [Aeromicrobium camelliae]RQN01980.1 cell filamentation protein Fic [Aeromicrobium camelliae]
MSRLRPWETGDHASRWDGYFDESLQVLRNKVGATTPEQLRDAENDLVEVRVAELRQHPALVPRTWDLEHVKGLHRQLFQDVYEWAGQLRTVGLAKGGGESFVPPLDIERPVAHVTARIVETDRLRLVPKDSLVSEVTYLYDYLNFAHPFREGNGRTQREFFAQLLAESGHGLAWDRTGMDDLHRACHLAREDGDSALLRDVIEQVLTDEPVY